MTQPPWPPAPPPTTAEAPSWESAPLPPGLPPGYAPGDQGGGGPWREGGALPPWEDRSAGHLARRFALTVGEVVLRPGALFERAGNGEDIGMPLLFAVAVATGARALQAASELLVGSRYTELLVRAIESAVTGKGAPTLGPVGSTGEGLTRSLTFVALTPVTEAIGLLVSGAVAHVLLMLVGGTNRGYAVTVRVFAYAAVAQLASFLPGVGPVIATIWAMVIHIVGLARAHRTDTGRAAIAVLAPTACGLLCGAAVILFLGAALFGALRSVLP